MRRARAGETPSKLSSAFGPSVAAAPAPCPSGSPREPVPSAGAAGTPARSGGIVTSMGKRKQLSFLEVVNVQQITAWEEQQSDDHLLLLC
ncbi:E3 ubiquitin-protein ligase TTC3 [Manis javanica]|nr:E3 ubiquitin-protein ligase TTC3 [Manis javanica]